jgi:hypothetical protein
MAIWEFVILLGVLIWMGLSLKPVGQAPTGWKYSMANISGYEDVETRLNELGRWGSELVLIWSPPGSDPKREIYASFKEPIPIGRPE